MLLYMYGVYVRVCMHCVCACMCLCICMCLSMAYICVIMGMFCIYTCLRV